ncbi:PulJ/GspJ family protein [Maricaulis sp.]|uniref:PulJ/GspJ family protein n=1 Tax=Maricaulis sp. TaxID=1486257 RepID=UPI003A9207CA
MEMLIALAVFAMLATMASHSLSLIASGYARVHDDYLARENRLRVNRVLQRAMDAGAVVIADEEMTSDRGDSEPQPGAALTITQEAGQSFLIWQRATGGEERARLNGGEFHLRVEPNAHTGPVVTVIERQGDEARVIAIARALADAPKDCRFEAIGRRCLENAR